MAKVVNKNQNASARVNDVDFRPQNGFMVSVDHVDEENLDMFRKIPGFHILEDDPSGDHGQAKAPVIAPTVLSYEITGSVADSGAMTASIPMPDGSSVDVGVGTDGSVENVVHKPAAHKPAASKPAAKTATAVKKK